MPCSSSSSIYDRQLKLVLFKRLHATHWGLVPKVSNPILGPGSYNPKTVEEIYRKKPCSRYGPYYQQSRRFSSSKDRRSTPQIFYAPREENSRRSTAIRFDRQSSDCCRQRRALVPRAPPVTLYEKNDPFKTNKGKSRIPRWSEKFSVDRLDVLPDWFQGPARSPSPSILDELFSRSNRYKGKFYPLPSQHRPVRKTKSPVKKSPLPSASKAKASLPSFYGFLSSSERFSPMKSDLPSSFLRPGFYSAHSCFHRC